MILLRLSFSLDLVVIHFYQLYDLNNLFQVVKDHISLVLNEGLFSEDIVLNY